MDVLPNTVYAREAFLPMSFCSADFATNYVPFVTSTDALKADREWMPKNVRIPPLASIFSSLQGWPKCRPANGGIRTFSAFAAVPQLRRVDVSDAHNGSQL